MPEGSDLATAIHKNVEKASQNGEDLLDPGKHQARLRANPNPIQDNNERTPSNPIRGNMLPVCGNSAGAAREGAGPAAAIRIGASAGGGVTGSGGGILPVTCCVRVT